MYSIQRLTYKTSLNIIFHTYKLKLIRHTRLSGEVTQPFPLLPPSSMRNNLYRIEFAPLVANSLSKYNCRFPYTAREGPDQNPRCLISAHRRLIRDHAVGLWCYVQNRKPAYKIHSISQEKNGIYYIHVHRQTIEKLYFPTIKTSPIFLLRHGVFWRCL